MVRRMFHVLASLLVFIILSHAPVVRAQILPGSPTTVWTPIIVDGPADPYGDSQSRRNDVEIIGDGGPHHALYRAFYGGTEGENFLDAEIGFRFRMSGTQGNSSDFGGKAWVGMDVTGDGVLDYFIGLDMSGNRSEITINAAGGDLNISPSTTSIDSNALWTTAATALNYRWEPVTAGPGGNDPSAVTNDLDGNGRVDHFLSFKLPFPELVTVVQTLVPGFDTQSPVGYIAGTATQGNTINADLNGVDGGNNSTRTWQELGAMTEPTAIPEPRHAAVFLAITALLAGCLRGRRATANASAMS